MENDTTPKSEDPNREPNGYFKKGHKLGGAPRLYTEEKLSELAKSLCAWVESARRRNKFVLLSEWCFKEKFPPFHFAENIARSDEFKEAYMWAKAWQEHAVSTGALSKELDARFSQFFLSVNHGWTLNKDQENKEEKQKCNLEKLSDSIHQEVKEMQPEQEEDDE